MADNKKLSKIEKQAQMLRQNLILRKKQMEERQKIDSEKKRENQTPVEEKGN